MDATLCAVTSRSSDGPDGSKTPVPAVSPFFLTEAVSDVAMTYFHDQLFAAEPEIRAMFPAAMDTQRQRLYRALRAIAASGDEGETGRYLAALGRRIYTFRQPGTHAPSPVTW